MVVFGRQIKEVAFGHQLKEVDAFHPEAAAGVFGCLVEELAVACQEAQGIWAAFAFGLEIGLAAAEVVQYHFFERCELRRSLGVADLRSMHSIPLC